MSRAGLSSDRRASRKPVSFVTGGRSMRIRRLILLGALAVATLAAAAPLAHARSAVYGGGPFYSGGTAVMNTLRSSGFTTVVLWTIHVNSNGDLVLNDQLVASGG